MTKTVQEMISVMQAYADGKPVEYKNRVNDRGWEPSRMPVWSWGMYDYRIATIPDTIDWSHVSDDFICMARDARGTCYVYEKAPAVGYDAFSTTGNFERAKAFASYRRGTVDWKGSLVFRPGHESKEDAA